MQMAMTLWGFLNRKVLTFLLVLLCFVVKAQQQGANIYSGDSLKSQKSILLVPFDPILYNSEIDRELAKHNNLNYDQIREKFRTELDLQVGMFLKGRYDVIAPYREKDETIREDLKVIYAGIAFNYAPLKTAQGKAPKSSRSELRNGQIVEVDNSGHKFMSTVIKDEKLLPYLNNKYGALYYVFMTQFEIKNDMSDPQAVAMGRYSRNVMVHYNILDPEGKMVYGGIAKANVAVNEYDIKKIAVATLREIAIQVSNSMPQ